MSITIGNSPNTAGFVQQQPESSEPPVIVPQVIDPASSQVDGVDVGGREVDGVDARVDPAPIDPGHRPVGPQPPGQREVDGVDQPVGVAPGFPPDSSTSGIPEEIETENLRAGIDPGSRPALGQHPLADEPDYIDG